MKVAVLDANAFWTQELYSACARFADVLLLKPRDFRAHHKLNGTWRSDAVPRKIKERVWEQRFSMPTGWMFSLWPLAERSIAKHIRHFAGQDPLVLIIVYPQYRRIIRLLRPALSVYYNLDDYSDNWPRRSHALANWEKETVVNADVTICIAQHRAEKLQTRVPEKVRDIFHLPLGCTPEFMASSTSDWKIPDALRKIRRPMAGHIGALNFRFDFEFLSDVAERLPDVSFVIGGDLPSEGDGNASWWSGYKRARKLPNVHFIGWIEHTQLGDFLQSFDVLVMPYSECTFNLNACPAKLWDNLGSGRPIVANEANPETLHWRRIIRIGGSPSDFANQIRLGLAQDSAEECEKRLEVARAHTWEMLSYRLETTLKDALTKKHGASITPPIESLRSAQFSPLAFFGGLFLALVLLTLLFAGAFFSAGAGTTSRMLAAVLMFATGYAFLNTTAWLRNAWSFRNWLNLPSCRRLLVIAAHQDDETVAAGASIVQTVKNGGEVWVLYTTNGVSRRKFPDDSQVIRQAEIRRQEALKALAIVGANVSHIECLGFENEADLWDANAIERATVATAQRITEIAPDRIITLAYEGGHPDHDVTNYIASAAAERAGFPSARVFEAPAYNRFYFVEPFLRRLNKILLVRFALPPRLPSNGIASPVRCSSDERKLKLAMLACFVSQDPEALMERFNYPDQLRVMPKHDYAQGPFDPLRSLRFRMERLFRGDRAFPYFSPEFGSEAYRRLFTEAEAHRRTIEQSCDETGSFQKTPAMTRGK